ncbi:zinc finger CCCH domain-containing protein 3-like [Amaranthus tricolor]|uniref:zinc finger CCCH domain-containing protein 3-like n=1 Tax=Amaranthus tricolor TaxID=29722 RepID=UPI002589A2E4|nr:zinc finger CCCH domain-containing protein 3-like [Amaranthus tricolor]
MSEIPENQTNAASVLRNEDIDKIQEGMSEMKIEEKEIGVGELQKYPDRPGEPDCLYYLRTGSCGYGTNCRFNHPLLPPSKTAQNTSELPQREGQPDCGTAQITSVFPQRDGQIDCGFFIKTGTCKYGSSCKYHHPPDRRGAGNVTLNTLGYPIRQEEKPCPFYMRTYACKFGSACKFDHPQPVSFGTSLPTGSNFPSNTTSYVGTPPALYAATPVVPSPQTYMPVVYPPLQTLLTGQCWNTHMGNFSSMPASAMTGPNFVYNPMNQSELTTSAPVNLSTKTISNTGESRDQPECKYFSSPGGCKYGSNCKFHHPKETMAYILGPHGFPLRPGEDPCAHFRSYGNCKYGPTCKFDHPIYVTSYCFGIPSLPMVIPNSTDASQTKITDWIQKPEIVQDKKLQSSPSKSMDPAQEVRGDHPDNSIVAAAVSTSERPLENFD